MNKTSSDRRGRLQRAPRRGVMGKLAICVCLLVGAVSPLTADQAPGFYFGGKAISIGMSKHDAAALLQACCQLSPDIETEKPPPSGIGLGHFILSKEEPHLLLGTIFLVDGRVARITRPLDNNVNPESADAVALGRLIIRALSQREGDSASTIQLKTQHQRLANGESETLFLSYANGKGIELKIATLDTPSPISGNRDSVSLDEALTAPK